MQKQLLLLSFLLTSVTLFAQENGGTKKDERTTVSKQATFIAFETVLADGKLYLTKTATANGSGGSNSVYFILNKSNPGFNAGKPYQVTLTKDAFDTYFTKTTPELAQKWPQLVKYAQDKKLSLNEEQGWINVLNYYNSLK